MTNLASKMNSYRPSISSNSFATAHNLVSKPSNPTYTSKPNRNLSDQSLDDGNHSSSPERGEAEKSRTNVVLLLQNDTNPLSPKEGDKNIDDDIDADSQDDN